MIAFFRYLALQFGTAQPGACQFHSVVECFSATSDIRDAPLLFISLIDQTPKKELFTAKSLYKTPKK